MAQTATLSSALKGIVGDARIESINPLVHNRVYAAVGSAGAVTASPAAVHFGGFVLGRVHQQVVQLQNVSLQAARVHVLPPDSSYFKVLHKRSTGAIAPGLSVELVVEFCPDHWRYYYDCIRVNTQEGNLLIPIHAYPVMNETKFPSRIDFGRLALGETTSRTVSMRCKVPIDFEFSISFLKPSRCFTVSPDRGTVPASGAVDVTVTFTPLALITEEATLKVEVAEFNSQPCLCVVVGSAFPGLSRERLIMGATGTASPTMEQLTGSTVLQRGNGSLGRSGTGALMQTNKGGGTVRGGAGGGDAYTMHLAAESRASASLRDCRRDGPIVSKPPAKPQEQPGEAKGDTLIPARLDNQAAANYVLTQAKGKLRVKDIKATIAVRKQELAAEADELQAVLAEGDSSGVDPLDRPGISAAVKAALFKLQLEEAEEAAKRSTGAVGSSGVVIGEDVMTPEAIAAVQAARREAFEEHRRAVELEAMHRVRPELSASGALHVCRASTSGRSEAGPGSSGPMPEGYPGLQDFTPQFLLLESSDWRKRVQVLGRFVNAARKVIYQLRAQRRLQKLKAIAGRLGGNRDAMAGAAVQDVVLEASLVSRPGVEPTSLMLPERVRSLALPLYRAGAFRAYDEVPAGEYADWDELQPLPMQTPLEYKLLGYTPEELTGLTAYAPPLLDQPLMEGAGEESGSERPCGVLPPGLLPAASGMPDAVRQMPYVSLEIGNRYSDDQVFAPLWPSWGLDAGVAIQPRALAFHDSTRTEAVGSCAVRALAHVPLLAQRWAPGGDRPMLDEGPGEKLLGGPDPADAMPEGPEDADKPPLAVKAPTDEALARLLPAVAGGTEGGVGVLPRQRIQRELDADKQRQHEAGVAEVVACVASYNRLLARPHQLAVQL